MLIREQQMLEEIKQRLARISTYLSDHPFPELENALGWFDYLNDIKNIQGNFNNDMSFVATILAKEYLENNFGYNQFNAADKPQGAPGLDIEIQLSDGRKLAGEIKTTIPYKPNDLGAQQVKAFNKDFKKISEAKAAIKLFLLTSPKTYELMKKPKYKSKLAGVRVVLLTTGEEFQA